MSIQLLSLEGLMRKTGSSRSKVLRDVKSGILPPPRKLGPTTNRWVESEVDERLLNLPVASAEQTRQTI